MCGRILPQSCMVHIYLTLLSFVSRGKLGIGHAPWMCLSLLGHIRKPLERKRRTIMVLFANCVHTV